MRVDRPSTGPASQPAPPGDERQRERDQRSEQDGGHGQPDVLVQVPHDGVPVVRHVGRVEPRVRRRIDRDHALARRAHHRAPPPEKATSWTLLPPHPPPAAPPPSAAVAGGDPLEGVSKVYADGTVGVAELTLTFPPASSTVLDRAVRVRQDDHDEDDQPDHRADHGGSCSVPTTSPAWTRSSCGAGSATSSRTWGSSRTRRSAPTWAPSPGC